MTAWAHLPNAAYIDRILAHLKAYPGCWSVDRNSAWSEAYNAAAWNASLKTGQDAAWGTIRGVVWNVIRYAVRDVTFGAAMGDARNSTDDAARGAVLALVAYDDCAYILDLPSGAVRVMVSAGDQKAVLLHPAVVAMNGETP